MENGLCPGKKHQHHAAPSPRRHGLFLSSLFHYPRQGYRVTIMNPFGGKGLSLPGPQSGSDPRSHVSVPLLFFLLLFFQPLSVRFCLAKTSLELQPGSSGNATSQPTLASSELPDNDALFQGSLQTDDGMLPQAKGYRAKRY